MKPYLINWLSIKKVFPLGCSSILGGVIIISLAGNDVRPVFPSTHNLMSTSLLNPDGNETANRRTCRGEKKEFNDMAHNVSESFGGPEDISDNPPCPVISLLNPEKLF